MVEFRKSSEVDVESVSRMTWDSPIQFFFTVLGFCVGLGNIWRFPYLCQQNGGGAFIIPFFVMLIVVGMPLLLLELGLGQKLRVGAAGAWKLVHPSLSGVGYGSTIVATLVGCYYNVIIAWCLFYLGSSFQLTLPWSECPLTEANLTIPECENSSETQYFWFRTTLDASGSIDNMDGIRWWNLVCLIVAWIVVYLILMKGIASSGKVVYFTALFPYLVLTIFFFRGITLKGATEGLIHMFTPKMEMLLKPTVWLDAANQVFYSFGLAFGSIINFGPLLYYSACEKSVNLSALCYKSNAIKQKEELRMAITSNAPLNVQEVNLRLHTKKLKLTRKITENNIPTWIQTAKDISSKYSEQNKIMSPKKQESIKSNMKNVFSPKNIKKSPKKACKSLAIESPKDHSASEENKENEEIMKGVNLSPIRVPKLPLVTNAVSMVDCVDKIMEAEHLSSIYVHSFNYKKQRKKSESTK